MYMNTQYMYSKMYVCVAGSIQTTRHWDTTERDEFAAEQPGTGRAAQLPVGSHHWDVHRRATWGSRPSREGQKVGRVLEDFYSYIVFVDVLVLPVHRSA